jgi:hypothetical protein
MVFGARGSVVRPLRAVLRRQAGPLARPPHLISSSQISRYWKAILIALVAAPGAVGKSTYARKLCDATSFALIDLAKTEPLGGNFFTGGIANAFGYEALASVTRGKLGLIVDALDEAQLRSGVEGFGAGLLDLGKIVGANEALPAALFGRAAAAEEAWLRLSDAKIDVCLLQIEFFDEPKAIAYIQRKLPVVAKRREKTAIAYERHKDVFLNFALSTRLRLTSTPGGEERRFAGYAPVLDAICSFALEQDALNPAARAAELEGNGPVEPIDSIARSILERERGKVVAQLTETGLFPAALSKSEIYPAEEQIGRVAAILLGSPAPRGPTIVDRDQRQAYDEMIRGFSPQHPFLDGAGGPANVAFAAFVLVWALTSSDNAAEPARKVLQIHPNFASGIFFELYARWLREKPSNEAAARVIPLADVGPLYAALVSQVDLGERPALEISEQEGEQDLEVSFEIVRQIDTATGERPDGRQYGPFSSSSDGILELRGPISNAFINAPIIAVVGDDIALTMAAL